mgnify:FL=1
MGEILDARKRLGGLSKTSKMPCLSFGLSALLCTVGALLRKAKVTIKGKISPCRMCYAQKGAYVWRSVREAHARRLEAWKNNPNWISDFVVAIHKQEYFRWFDSGDLQSLSMLEAIVEVAKRTPNTKHWLPTHEYGLVKEYRKKHGASLPSNLTLRVSAAFADDVPPNFANTSTTHSREVLHDVECLAYLNDNQCGECRNCWDSNILNISYKLH